MFHFTITPYNSGSTKMIWISFLNMSILTSSIDWNPSSARLTVFPNPRLHMYPVNLLFLLKDIKSTIPGFKNGRLLQFYMHKHIIRAWLEGETAHLNIICLLSTQLQSTARLAFSPVGNIVSYWMCVSQPTTLACSSISASDSSNQRSKSGARNRGFFSCSVRRSHQRSCCFLILMSTWRWVDLWQIWEVFKRTSVRSCFYVVQ